MNSPDEILYHNCIKYAGKNTECEDCLFKKASNEKEDYCEALIIYLKRLIKHKNVVGLPLPKIQDMLSKFVIRTIEQFGKWTRDNILQFYSLLNKIMMGVIADHYRDEYRHSQKRNMSKHENEIATEELKIENQENDVTEDITVEETTEYLQDIYDDEEKDKKIIEKELDEVGEESEDYTLLDIKHDTNKVLSFLEQLAKNDDKCAQFYLDYYRLSHSIEKIDNMASEMGINRRTFFRRKRECRERFKEILAEYKKMLEYF